jgi:uncharacterized membrane protein
MEIKTATRTGGGITIQTLLFVFAILELFELVKETRGDFANGILFFLSGQLNPFEIIGLALLFTITYFLGRNAGKEILLDGRNSKWVGVKYALLTIAVFTGILLCIYAANDAPQSAWKALTFVVITFSISILITWLWAVWRIKQVQKVKA